MLSWPGNSWVYWAVSAAAVFLLLRVFVYGDRFSLRSRRARLAIVAGGAASVIITGLTLSIVNSCGRASTSPDWWINPALWLGGTIVAAAALFLLAWAVFADRSRGRRRCPRCWYDMSATTGLKCPECGRDAKGERHLFSTRRRKWIAALATVFMFAGSVSAAVPWAKYANWEETTPDWVVLMALPYISNADRGPKLANWFGYVFVERCGIVRTPSTPPLYGELQSGKASARKRKLAHWAAATSLRDNSSERAKSCGLHLATALGKDAVDLAPRIEELAKQCGLSSWTRRRALDCLDELPSQGERVWRCAVVQLRQSDATLHRHAIITLAGISNRHRSRRDPPAELLACASGADPDIRSTALIMLGCFNPTPAAVQLLESQVELGKGDADILRSLVRLHPGSEPARRWAFELIASQSVRDVDVVLKTIVREAWYSRDLLDALANRLAIAGDAQWLQRSAVEAASAPRLTAQQRFDVLSALNQSTESRMAVAAAFELLGDRGRDVLPRLHQLAAEWDSTDPGAAARLRKSIDIIEGRTDPDESR